MSLAIDPSKPKLIVIVGPTEIGKTATALALADKCGCEIVGADSMQIYRYMDIGTAKPTVSEQARVPHHMIDVADPDEPFDAAKYACMARGSINILNNKNGISIVAGGTGLYIKALLSGLFAEGAADETLRQHLKQEASQKGAQYLHDRLRALDPEAASRIHPNDAFRITRALEVHELTGQSITAHQSTHQFCDQPYDALKIGLRMDRQLLYGRINRRVDAMISAGLVDEVKGLITSGYAAQLKSMQSIGYRHMALYLQGKLPLDEAVGTMKRDTRRYAKRQMTWFRKDVGITWIDPNDLSKAAELVDTFLSKS